MKVSHKINDFVQAIDADFEGKIVTINDGKVDVEGDDGFVIRFRESELIPAISRQDAQKLGEVPNHVKIQKEIPTKPPSKRIKSKERYLPPMEVDLHIHKLTKSTKSMSNYDMLNLQMDTAKRQLEFAIRKRIPKIVFIHGAGEGVLKEELVYLFRNYESLKYYDADYQKYGAGATEVYIYQNPKN